MQWLASHPPSVSLAVIPEAGHVVFLEQPAEFTRLSLLGLTPDLRDLLEVHQILHPAGGSLGALQAFER